MTDFLLRIEQSGLATWVRESNSIWAYPSFLLFHTIGMALVVAVIAGFVLRILGLAPGIPLMALHKYFPILWVGFWVNVVTGTVLVAADATTKLVTPLFYAKMVFLALALISLRLLERRVFRRPLTDTETGSVGLKALAVTSMVFWLAVVTAGRWMAYVGVAKHL